MRGCWVFLLWFCMMGGALAENSPVAAPKDIRLVSEPWDEYTDANGSGLGWDILREVFEPQGVKVQTRSAPYIRSIGLVKRGEADAWVGAYQDEVGGALYPRWHYDTDHIYALGLANRPTPTLSTLGHYRLAWVRGYQYQRYLPNVNQYNEIQRRDSIVSMLDHERADFYIDAKTEIDHLVSVSGNPGALRATHLAELPLFLGFADTPKGKALRSIYDQRMAHLVRSGQLRPIFARWRQPYPFEDEESHPQSGEEH
ncbi:substrate-binding periplasmic protein [Pseudomonas sp. NA-150]|uniref:substrate-binding periplasmic protein n=1 Tax=Pseudomonas sp. NA-150 TaxID=3367525 RepID=UPI0037C7698C